MPMATIGSGRGWPLIRATCGSQAAICSASSSSIAGKWGANWAKRCRSSCPSASPTASTIFGVRNTQRSRSAGSSRSPYRPIMAAVRCTLMAFSIV
jgi:hypothetical protein